MLRSILPLLVRCFLLLPGALLGARILYQYDADRYANDTRRVAIIISGQFRSANLSWTSGYIQNFGALRMFGATDPPTPALTMVEFLFKSLVDQDFHIDVFMYVSANSKKRIEDWNGNPLQYDPTLADTLACQVFSNNRFFSKNSSNNFFCLVEPERNLLNPWIREFAMYNRSSLGVYGSDAMKEQALQQYYGMYRGNRGAKQFSIMNNFEYKYKIRMRPDSALTRPFPALDTFNFHSTVVADGKGRRGCKEMVYFSNKFIDHGHNDYFAIGISSVMDILFDRYLDFTENNNFFLLRNGNSTGTVDHWILEDYFENVLYYKYGICLDFHSAIWLVLVRQVNRCQGIYGCILDMGTEKNPYFWKSMHE